MTVTPRFIYDFCAPPWRLSALAGGLSNDNFKLSVELGDTEQRFFVRQFGALYHDLANNSAHEYAAQQQAAAQGLAPAIQYHCQQGLISDWIEGGHWDSVQQAEPANIIRLAKLVASLAKRIILAGSACCTESQCPPSIQSLMRPCWQ